MPRSTTLPYDDTSPQLHDNQRQSIHESKESHQQAIRKPVGYDPNYGTEISDRNGKIDHVKRRRSSREVAVLDEGILGESNATDKVQCSQNEHEHRVGQEE